ncbi:MAG TPA: hypothetical protein VEV44_15630 [Pseudoneobacillus sp.]|nr:hypothetical protein [Pseudoneobacillus sp.]
MNKRSIRAFSLGIFFAVSIVGSFYLTFDEKPKEKNISIQDAKKVLKDKNYLIYSQEEFEAKKERLVEETTEKNKKENKQKEEQKNDTTTESTTITYHLEIVSGMTSNDIVDRLYEAEIIKNPNEFQRFLDNHQFSTKIQLGIFVIKSNMSLEQIAKIITKS